MSAWIVALRWPCERADGLMGSITSVEDGVGESGGSFEGEKGVSERERKNVCQRAHDDPSYLGTYQQTNCYNKLR